MSIKVLGAAFVFTFSCLTSANTAAPHKQEDPNALAEDFEQTKKKLEEAEIKQRQVLSALYQLNKKIKKTVTEKGELSQRRALLEVNIKNLSQKVEELASTSKAQKALLAERLRVIYKLGGQSVTRLLFSAASSSEMDRNLKILGIVARRDLDLIKDYSRDLQELERRKQKLGQKLANLKDIETKIAQQEKNLIAEQNLKNKLLDGIRRKKLFAINKINGLREKSLQYNIDDAGLFDLLFKPSFADQKGNLPLPVEGTIVKKFGLVKGQEQPYTLNHKGVVIATSPGTPVKAIFGGKVSYVGTLPGFGKTLILDHGDHYYSVYARTDEVNVNIGDEILPTQVIASAGRSIDTPPELYFEIRHFSEPYDPQQWMKGL